ncbi:MAG: hypothetical protein AAGL98_08240 [Planctomycetota bacterium]
MSYRELQEWRFAYALEPWGDVRDDGRADAISNVIVGVNTPKGATFKHRRYAPDYRKPRLEPQSMETMQATARKITAMMGARRRADREKSS